MLATENQIHLQAYRVKLQDHRASQYWRGLLRCVIDAVESGDRHVVLDCQSLSDMDVMLLSTLVNCATVCAEHGAQFELKDLRTDLRSRVAPLCFEGSPRFTATQS